MNDYAQWLEANDRYLAAALAELRARLQRGAQRHDEAAAPADKAVVYTVSIIVAAIVIYLTLLISG